MTPPTHAMPASLWAATAAPAPACPPWSGDRQVEVAVVGGGFAGLSAALHLAREGREVALVETAEPGWGASGRNGGQVIAGLKHDPDALEKTFGPKLGAAMVREFGGGADLVFSLIDRYTIDCDDRRTGWLQAAHAPKAMRELVIPRCSQWSARGAGTRLLDAAEATRMVGAPPGVYCGGWYDPRGGVLQPLSYARGLAAAVLSEGGGVHARSPVRRLARSGEGWELALDGGTLRAKQVLLATNGYTGGLWPGLRRTVIPVTSFQFATRPLPDVLRARIIPGGQGVTDSRRLLLYFRLDGAGRLVMGGRSPVDDNPAPRDAAPLQAAVRRTFPEVADLTPDYVWSGRVAVTKDSMPHLHMLAPGLYAALGFNGRGVAAATIMGRLAARLMQGTAPVDLCFPVTAPDPFALHELRKLGVFAVSQYYRLLDALEARQTSIGRGAAN